MSPCCLEKSVLGNSLYTLARYARRWGGGNVVEADPGTPARGHLADGWYVYYKHQLATQVDRGQVHLSQKSDAKDITELTSETVRKRVFEQIRAAFKMCFKGLLVTKNEMATSLG